MRDDGYICDDDACVMVFYVRVLEGTDDGGVWWLQAASEGEGRTVVAVAHASVIAAFICLTLQLPGDRLGTFRIDTAGVTVIDFPDNSTDGLGNVRCSNYTAHLGRWAVPITVEDMDLVCGVDGCF
mmetsp:Transcript_37750/g.67665  ORF Transcript_37750/g.67665 Transcript_37750/m.67665 type:complete len:126 (-) Transcript_37750:226-603(-)